jgi:hypothetical protein
MVSGRVPVAILWAICECGNGEKRKKCKRAEISIVFETSNWRSDIGWKIDDEVEN